VTPLFVIYDTNMFQSLFYWKYLFN